MEWNRIESKWNEMARRLQNMTPNDRQKGHMDALRDAVSRPEPKSSPAPVVTEAAKPSVRATV